ncbi:MAG TPA: hypothetical protein VLD58_07670 [Gemmatimonadales bacterium]|nr:hypothetical protein [Gemmatimonadales bacterium]
MRLRNSTDLPDDLIRQVVAFVRPPGISRFTVRVQNHHRSHFSGCAGGGLVTVRLGSRPRTVELWPKRRRALAAAKGHPYEPRFAQRGVTWPMVPGDLRQRRRKSSRGGYLPLPALADRTEALVYVMAHELRHLWQARIPRGRRVWGARGQFSERDADAYALRQLRRWRREGPPRS